jgi:hypothetical protein
MNPPLNNIQSHRHAGSQTETSTHDAQINPFTDKIYQHSIFGNTLSLARFTAFTSGDSQHPTSPTARGSTFTSTAAAGGRAAGASPSHSAATPRKHEELNSRLLLLHPFPLPFRFFSSPPPAADAVDDDEEALLLLPDPITSTPSHTKPRLSDTRIGLDRPPLSRAPRLAPRVDDWGLGSCRFPRTPSGAHWRSFALAQSEKRESVR